MWTHYLHASLTIIGCAPLYSISQDAELHDRYVRETTDLKKQLEQALKRVADNASAADADKKAAVEAMQRQVDALTAERTELNGIVERARRAHEKMVDEVNTLRQVGGVAAAAAGGGWGRNANGGVWSDIREYICLAFFASLPPHRPPL